MVTETKLKPIEMDEATWTARLDSELRRFIDLLVREFDPIKIILFGSLAEGTPRLWSDIDIVVVRETDKNFIERAMEIQRRFDSNVGVDLLVYTPEEFEHMRAERLFFQQEILRKGKIIYERA
jgi:predicted nucleotidyltransferase